jgi:hypothetical protein
MIISIIGRKEKKHKNRKENYYPFGDSAIKKRKNMSLLLYGILSIKTSLQFH